MENRELINCVVNATIDFLRENYRGLNSEFYCEVTDINYGYDEGDYNDAYVTVKCRCGRYKEGGDKDYNFKYDFTLSDVQDKTADFIAGMIHVVLAVKMDFYDI